jgi:hypothetical protein
VPGEHWLTASTAQLAHFAAVETQPGGLAPPFHAAMPCYGAQGGAQWLLWNRYLGNPGKKRWR